MIIERSSRFKRSYKKLPSAVRKDFDKHIITFFQDPFHPSLKTHKLHGHLDSCYAFCLRDGYRVLFTFEDDTMILIVNVGSHDEYTKWERT